MSSAGRREDALAIWRAGVAGADAGAAVRRWLGAHGHELDGFSKVWVLAVGKAAPEMATAVAEALPADRMGGAVTTKDHHGAPIPGLSLFRAGHPVPDEGSGFAADAALGIAEAAREGELVLVLLSGGASSLWYAPEVLDDDHLRHWEASLGDPIEALNAWRTEGSRIKGGKLADAARPATVWTVAVSDVPSDPRWIGSGPSWPGDRFDVVADVLSALEAAEAEARARGYGVQKLRGYGPHDVIVQEHTGAAQGASPHTAVLSAGETDLHVSGSGRGGRSQHFALAVAISLHGVDNWTLVAAGTDGTDGPTHAAGGVVDGGTLDRAAVVGIDARIHLRDFDSLPLLEAAGDLLVTGPTGTNVTDLRVLLVE